MITARDDETHESRQSLWRPMLPPINRIRR